MRPTRAIPPALLILLITVCFSASRAQPISHTLYDTTPHLMTTLDSSPYNMGNINDQVFTITNASGQNWVAFRLWLDARDYYGLDFGFEGLTDYNGPGYPMFTNPDEDTADRFECLTAYLLTIPDGSNFNFNVDMIFFPPEGCTISDIWGDPVVLEVERTIDLLHPTRLAIWGWETMILADLPFTLINETDLPWREFHLTLDGLNAQGGIFQYARFDDTDDDLNIYFGPGDPLFIDTDTVGGEETLHIRDLMVLPGEALSFSVDWTCTPQFGPPMDSLSVIGHAITESSAAPEELAPGALPQLSCAPNPFNPSTTIGFTLPESVDVTLSIYCARGRHLRDLVSKRCSAGQHSVSWNGCDATGQALSSGVYIAHLRAGDHESAHTLVLLK